MIVAETAESLRFVTQPAHAALAGQFADAWGNDRFDPPTPAAAVALAAHAHDDGWAPYDRRPHLHDDGTPVDFYELGADPWTDLYAAGIEAVAALDPYAGLLVSMHGAGLRRWRYGLSPTWPAAPAAFEPFVEREEERQRELFSAIAEGDRADPVDDRDAALLEALHDTGTATAGADGRLWANYRLLQAWDALSLAFCTTTEPPGTAAIEAVPRAPGDPGATLRIEPAGRDGFAVWPWPFDRPTLDVTVAARTVDRSAFDDEDALLRAYYGAPLEHRRFRLHDPST